MKDKKYMILKTEFENGQYKFVLATDEVIGSVKQDITKDVLFFIYQEKIELLRELMKEVDKLSNEMNTKRLSELQITYWDRETLYTVMKILFKNLKKYKNLLLTLKSHSETLNASHSTSAKQRETNSR